MPGGFRGSCEHLDGLGGTRWFSSGVRGRFFGRKRSFLGADPGRGYSAAGVTGGGFSSGAWGLLVPACWWDGAKADPRDSFQVSLARRTRTHSRGSFSGRLDSADRTRSREISLDGVERVTTQSWPGPHVSAPAHHPPTNIDGLVLAITGSTTSRAPARTPEARETPAASPTEVPGGLAPQAWAFPGPDNATIAYGLS